MAGQMAALHDRARVWCIFDNTGSGAAVQNALELTTKLSQAASVTTL
jgi:uncharacterized protein YecE (DUF72 family)